MAQDKGPVVVTLSCEANPKQETVEIDRAEWDAMTPAERARMLSDMAVDHINNSGGGGWWIDDPEDSAAADAVGEVEPDPLRELAEWILRAGQNVTNDQIVTRAREALGKEG